MKNPVEWLKFHWSEFSRGFVEGFKRKTGGRGPRQVLHHVASDAVRLELDLKRDEDLYKQFLADRRTLQLQLVVIVTMIITCVMIMMRRYGMMATSMLMVPIITRLMFKRAWSTWANRCEFYKQKTHEIVYGTPMPVLPAATVPATGGLPATFEERYDQAVEIGARANNRRPVIREMPVRDVHDFEWINMPLVYAPNQWTQLSQEQRVEILEALDLLCKEEVELILNGIVYPFGDSPTFRWSLTLEERIEPEYRASHRTSHPRVFPVKSPADMDLAWLPEVIAPDAWEDLPVEKRLEILENLDALCKREVELAAAALPKAKEPS